MQSSCSKPQLCYSNVSCVSRFVCIASECIRYDKAPSEETLDERINYSEVKVNKVNETKMERSEMKYSAPFCNGAFMIWKL